MGCDIHAMIEAKHRYNWNLDSEGHWASCGRIKIDRNYDLFARLADVRNYIGVKPISKPRFEDPDIINECEDWYSVCSEDFYCLSKHWAVDAHSHSWVSLRELDSADPELALKARNIVTIHGYNPEEARLIFFFDN